jgi:N-acyl amino acid synthase of PEP-CTERM/exosortase system
MSHFLSDVKTDYSPNFRGIEVKPGRDAQRMQEMEALRFQVYCMECGFLNPLDYPLGQEQDEHDAGSSHFGAYDPSEELAGYVRLVRPDAIDTFPFQNHCVSLLDGVNLPPAAQSAEISRLMVREDLRRRRTEALPSRSADESGASAAMRRLTEMRDPSPQIVLSLYRQMYQYSLRNGIRYWYAAMERALARSLNRMQFSFRQIGPATDYYGPVAPYVADLRELEHQLERFSPSLLNWMRQTEPQALV